MFTDTAARMPARPTTSMTEIAYRAAERDLLEAEARWNAAPAGTAADRHATYLLRRAQATFDAVALPA
ncbi:hypothetical protein [Aeromicrobium sp. Leaf291]|uniref:hypothetical protein n=1 Tax=Aeromicrobium sp. Leaf291 TaxID=1736325 RepID=UPI0006FEADE9|nr:hypothetical protein [Aeromicrobium sp. Leaf291]KQP81631.1 hypothetical protein ASF35_16500 [Aeromicrobium sp. Leaf291]